jgi:hypothetical protein
MLGMPDASSFAEEEGMMVTPRSAVMSWWQTMQDKDLPALERMTLDCVGADGWHDRSLGVAA